MAKEVSVETHASILVVDDDATVRDCVQRMLEIAGYEVIPARDGVEALAILDVRPVDLILADIAMPRMNGYQLYERVVKNPEWVVLPFVFLTARAMDSDIRYGKALGVDDYLVKPFAREDLLALCPRGPARRDPRTTVARPSGGPGADLPVPGAQKRGPDSGQAAHRSRTAPCLAG